MSDNLFGTLSGLPSFGKDDMARYQTFRKVLFESEEGKKVLHEILGWCQILNVMPPAPPIDPYLLSFHEGERHIGSKIIRAMLIEPREKPTQSTKYKPK